MNMRTMVMAVMAMACITSTRAQRIDVNNSSNRTEDGYTGWVIGTVPTASITVGNITVTAAVEGGAADRTLKGEWWKDGINKYSVLTSDGVGVFGLDSDKNTPQIQQGAVGLVLTISGLAAGEHSLMAYHNNPSGYSGPAINVYVDGVLKAEGVEQTNRAQSVSESGRSYVRFTAEEGKSVEIVYRSVPDEETDYTQGYLTTSLFINSVELDVNPFAAADPQPANLDLHADCDDGQVTLSWIAVEGTVKNHVFMATNEEALAEAPALWTGTESQCTVTLPDTSGKAVPSLTKYYWRVDGETADGTVNTGSVWTFQPRRLAFPGAEGYGRFAIGGRGGTVYHVTSLDDDADDPQPGTFRYGITKVSGPRTIVFDVAGIIWLKNRLTCSDPYVTVAGQTAPAQGIMFRGAPFGMASDGITRFIRMRRGHIRTEDGTTVNSKGETEYRDANRGLDGLGMAGNDHSIMDHCSISWTIDEGFSSRGAKHITLQRTLIAEALNIAGHPNYADGKAHGFAATIGGGEYGSLGSSFHHNLLAHNEGRNWSISGGLDGSGAYDGHHDMFNNVCYNWGGRATDGGTHEGQFVGNYYKMGPSTTKKVILDAQLEGTGSGSQAYYVSGNIREDKKGNKTGDKLNDTYKYTLSGGQKLTWTVFVDQPFFESYATVQTAEQAYCNVLSDVGCNQPAFDLHDQRMVSETLTGTTTTQGSRSDKLGLIDHEDDAEGFDMEKLGLSEAQRPNNWDTDQDGIADWFENAVGTDPSTPNNNEDRDNDGYTDLEEYLNWLAEPHFTIAATASSAGSAPSVNLAPHFAGFQNYAVEIEKTETVVTANGTGNASDEIVPVVTILPSTTDMQVRCAVPCLLRIYVKATDQAGIEMTRPFHVCVAKAEETTGISGITMSETTEHSVADDVHTAGNADAAYKLNGQHIGETYHGTRLVKGKKLHTK